MRTKRRTISAVVAITFLAVMSARAGTENDSSSGVKVTPISAGSPASAKAAANERRAEQPAAAGYGAEIEQLRQQLAEQSRQFEAQRELLAEQARQLQGQQEKLAALTEELHAARSANLLQPAAGANAGSRIDATAASPEEVDLAVRLSKVEKDLDATKKGTEAKLKALGPFSFSGDIRLRDEPFFGGPTNESQVRNRERYRLRFNVNAKFEDVSGGFSLASGDINDPISTNQTTNQFYTRKIFALDRAFLSYNPHYFKPLTLTGGKFAYPWYNTELTWDKDLNPEGVAQTLAWNLEKTPVLKKIAVVGFELPFAEVAGISATNRSIVQNVVYGGQFQTTLRLASWLSFSAYSGFYNYHNADSIAFALATASLSNPQTPGSGLLKLNQSSVQNSIVTITRNTVVTANTGAGNTPTALPTGVTAIQSAQFASKFGLFDNIARFDVKTPYERWPVTLIGDYVQNARACANEGNTPATAPASTATATFTRTVNAPCDPHQRRGYWLEGRYGRAQEKGDWQFAYTRIFIEREAVVGAFNASDIRQNSNVSQHRVEGFYQAYRNVQFVFTGFFGRPLASTEPLLKRLQFDVIYKF